MDRRASLTLPPIVPTPLRPDRNALLNVLAAAVSPSDTDSSGPTSVSDTDTSSTTPSTTTTTTTTTTASSSRSRGVSGSVSDTRSSSTATPTPPPTSANGTGLPSDSALASLESVASVSSLSLVNVNVTSVFSSGGVVFTSVFSFPSLVPLDTEKHTNIKTGPLVGIVVGGVGAIAIFFVMAFFIRGKLFKNAQRESVYKPRQMLDMDDFDLAAPGNAAYPYGAPPYMHPHPSSSGSIFREHFPLPVDRRQSDSQSLLDIEVDGASTSFRDELMGQYDPDGSIRSRYSLAEGQHSPNARPNFKRESSGDASVHSGAPLIRGQSSPPSPNSPGFTSSGRYLVPNPAVAAKAHEAAAPYQTPTPVLHLRNPSLPLNSPSARNSYAPAIPSQLSLALTPSLSPIEHTPIEPRVTVESPLEGGFLSEVEQALWDSSAQGWTVEEIPPMYHTIRRQTDESIRGRNG